MSISVAFLLIALFFAATTMVVTVLVMRAPVMDDFDERDPDASSALTDIENHSKESNWARKHRRHPAPTSGKSPTILAPGTHLPTSALSQVKVPR